MKSEIPDTPPQVIGLQNLRIVKLNGLSKITNNSLIALCKGLQFLEHLELARCDSITEFSVNTIIASLNSLQFIDLNFIPAITPKELEEIRKVKPNLLIRRY